MASFPLSQDEAIKMSPVEADFLHKKNAKKPGYIIPMDTGIAGVKLQLQFPKTTFDSYDLRYVFSNKSPKLTYTLAIEILESLESYNKDEDPFSIKSLTITFTQKRQDRSKPTKNLIHYACKNGIPSYALFSLDERSLIIRKGSDPLNHMVILYKQLGLDIRRLRYSHEI